ncbi:hypothetical protein [Janibacter sp. G1551]|uniref:hypothetical protein n=1 Tax=Janibacter sp. G1551 TaxID=3420440 RepID=UPI003D00B6F4
MTSASPPRTGADRCPGLLAPFQAADGAMVRLRLPGGLVSTAALNEIASLAMRFGDPEVTLTSRGNLQLRGLPAVLPTPFVEGIEATGLMPPATHERARNIVADPLGDDLEPLVAALDAGLTGDPRLAELPGRFLFAVARPGGPVLAEPWDVAIVLDSTAIPATKGVGRVLVDGRAVTLADDLLVPTALAAARAFLEARPDARTWNVTDLPVAGRVSMLSQVSPPSPSAPTQARGVSSIDC